MDLLDVDNLHVWLDNLLGTHVTFPPDELRRTCARLEWNILLRAGGGCHHSPLAIVLHAGGGCHAIVHLLIRTTPASSQVFVQFTAVYAKRT